MHKFTVLMSNQELAEAIEYTRNKLSNLETGSGRPANLKRYDLFLEHLEVLLKVQAHRASVIHGKDIHD